VRRIEEGVRENALLAGPLEEQVARIERSLVPVLEEQLGALDTDRGGHD
jgi:hypothetical protein